MKIKGFTTKGKTSEQVLKELLDAGVEFKLPFTATPLYTTKDPFKDIIGKDRKQIKFSDGKEYKDEKKKDKKELKEHLSLFAKAKYVAIKPVIKELI